MHEGRSENAPVVLVASCLSYADLWQPLSKSFQVFWPDHSYRVVLVTDEVREHSPVPRDWTVISAGEPLDWSSTLLHGLHSLSEHTSHCLLWIDDLLLTGRVDTIGVERLLKLAMERGWDYLRIHGGLAPPRVSIPEFGVGRLPEGDHYRAATVLSFWRVAALKQLLIPGESAWQFETHGSVRSDRFRDFFCADRSYAPLQNAVIKGKWDPRVLRRLSASGLLREQDVSRAVMTPGEVWKRRLNELRSSLFRLVPRRHRRSIHMALRPY